MKSLLGVVLLLPLCRPPHGGRGLKYGGNRADNQPPGSPPARGAWIEMLRSMAMPIAAEPVAPRTGGVD